MTIAILPSLLMSLESKKTVFFTMKKYKPCIIFVKHVSYYLQAGRYGELPHLVIPSKTANLVPEFAVEDLPLERTATLVPASAVKDLPLEQNMIFRPITYRVNPD